VSVSIPQLDLNAEYQGYLARFAAQVGEVEVGTFVKHGGRLVKKLRPDEFGPAFREYQTMTRHYAESLARGDTISDVIVRVMRQRAAELFLSCPV
jgi:hypothetical protein